MLHVNLRNKKRIFLLPSATDKRRSATLEALIAESHDETTNSVWWKTGDCVPATIDWFRYLVILRTAECRTSRIVFAKLPPAARRSGRCFSWAVCNESGAAIDEARETFEVAGYIIAKWRDPRLELTSDVAPDNPRPRTFKYEDLWTPPIEGSNSVFHKTNAYFFWKPTKMALSAIWAF